MIEDFSQPLDGNYRLEEENGYRIVNAYWIKEKIRENTTLRQQLEEANTSSDRDWETVD